MTKVGTMRCSMRLTAKPWSPNGIARLTACLCWSACITQIIAQKQVKDHSSLKRGMPFFGLEFPAKSLQTPSGGAQTLSQRKRCDRLVNIVRIDRANGVGDRPIVGGKRRVDRPPAVRLFADVMDAAVGDDE